MCRKLAYYFSEINVLHPFREGNGRTEREFLRTLSMSNGYTLNWDKVSQSELLRASIESVVNDKAIIPVMKKAIIEQKSHDRIKQKWENMIQSSPAAVTIKVENKHQGPEHGPSRGPEQ